MDNNVLRHYMTGISELDLDHTHMICVIEQIAAYSKASQPEEAQPFIAELVRLSDAHYRMEERLVEQIKFPYYNHHKSAHRSLVAELQEFIDEVEQGTIVDFKASKTIRHILDHINSYDMQYVPFYQAWLASQEQTTKNPA